ncbi:MAG: glutamate-5-semialdehyde dehydrogenase [Bacteroidales bacterium]|nr:glutamate-5-semialdehyde dehydrogenase [Bacteroidales bacterium]
MSIQEQLNSTREAARSLVKITAEESAKIIREIADALIANSDKIVAENAKDLARMDPKNPNYDRLMLNKERIEGIASDTRNVAGLPAPCGEVIEERTLENGLLLKKVRVPLGVVGVIYEARPNVTIDVASLCLRSGNAVVLKGGSDAADSNVVMVEIMHEVLRKNGLNENLIQLLPAGREAATELMNAVGYIDVLIPRGSRGLIDSVRQQAKVPVIETGAGVVHTYFDKDGDLKIATDVVVNAKTRRVSVCNALDCLIIHKDRLSDLPALAKQLDEKNVGIYADERAFATLKGKYNNELLHQASAEDFGREFLSLNMAIKTVDSLDEALDHIYKYGLKHSEAIVTENDEAALRFVNEVDAACCYVNTSTAFTDGAQFGLGAEIGISTQKLHARGPMALKELTSYKWTIFGKGQTRK